MFCNLQKSCFVCFNSTKSVLQQRTALSYPLQEYCWKDLKETPPHQIPWWTSKYKQKRGNWSGKQSLREHCWKCFTSPNDPIWTHKLNHLRLKTVFGKDCCETLRTPSHLGIGNHPLDNLFKSGYKPEINCNFLICLATQWNPHVWIWWFLHFFFPSLLAIENLQKHFFSNFLILKFFIVCIYRYITSKK